MATLRAKFLFDNQADRLDLQHVLKSAPTYSLRISGALPTSSEAQSLFSALPPDKNHEGKFVLGFYVNIDMVGGTDLIRGFPNRETAMLGLLLFSEANQGRGLGTLAYRKIEETCSSWSEIQILRIGVVKTNASALPFWKKMGFLDTGIRRPFKDGSVHSETIVLEKRIRAPDATAMST